MASTLRPRRADDLGLRRAFSGFMLPTLVAGMALLAALAGAGGLAASSLAARWRGGARIVTIQVPDPASISGATTRAAAVAALLGPDARRLPDAELAALLRPWLGEEAGRVPVALPAVFTFSGDLTLNLDRRLDQAAPGTLVAQDSLWQTRLGSLAVTLQGCALATMLIVTGVAAAIVALATGAGLSARRETVEIIHGLGATDGTIAARFSERVAILVTGGAVMGTLLSVVVLIALARLTTPAPPSATVQLLPPRIWWLLAGLPFGAGGIGWLTAQATVRRWLARLP